MRRYRWLGMGMLALAFLLATGQSAQADRKHFKHRVRDRLEDRRDRREDVRDRREDVRDRREDRRDRREDVRDRREDRRDRRRP